MMKLFVEVTPHEGDKVETEALGRLLITMGYQIMSKDFLLLQGPPDTRTVLLETDVVDLHGELVTAPCYPGEVAE